VIHASLLLELRTAIPPGISTDPAEMDQSKWQPWKASAEAVMQAQAELAAPKIKCRLVGRQSLDIEARLSEPAGRWLMARFEMEYVE
jgi:hypothetical protein